MHLAGIEYLLNLTSLTSIHEGVYKKRSPALECSCALNIDHKCTDLTFSQSNDISNDIFNIISSKN